MPATRGKKLTGAEPALSLNAAMDIERCKQSGLGVYYAL
jgi:hypothetical protein